MRTLVIAVVLLSTARARADAVYDAPRPKPATYRLETGRGAQIPTRHECPTDYRAWQWLVKNQSRIDVVAPHKEYGIVLYMSDGREVASNRPVSSSSAFFDLTPAITIYVALELKARRATFALIYRHEAGTCAEKWQGPITKESPRG